MTDRPTGRTRAGSGRPQLCAGTADGMNIYSAVHLTMSYTVDRSETVRLKISQGA
ncbi:hypothetical protein [Streptosporangium minutum]|uniref:hypothetical protein n=1 Tax=Streptosporangium minutum TaxID=569862 RepID=UPI0013FDAD1B|nr:hypothetical protein [Streptosporangium minutum]